MRRSVVVLCQDTPSLRTLNVVLGELGIDSLPCPSQHEAMELILRQACSALVVDFDVPGAKTVAKMASLLAPPQRPLLLAMESPWPGTGQAGQSGVNRILYKPLSASQLKDAFEIPREHKKKDRRTPPRYEIKTVVYLEFETGTLPAIGVNISEHGFAVRATERVSLRASLGFHCVLPGTTYVLHGHADVIWADDLGQAGLFFSRLAPAAHKQLRRWLSKYGDHGTGAVRALLPPVNAAVNPLVAE